MEATVLDILGGLRSSCTYVGASILKDLSKRTTFIRHTSFFFAGIQVVVLPLFVVEIFCLAQTSCLPAYPRVTQQTNDFWGSGVQACFSYFTF